MQKNKPVKLFLTLQAYSELNRIFTTAPPITEALLPKMPGFVFAFVV
jgi:hypothetical protein